MYVCTRQGTHKCPYKADQVKIAHQNMHLLHFLNIAYLFQIIFNHPYVDICFLNVNLQPFQI